MAWEFYTLIWTWLGDSLNWSSRKSSKLWYRDTMRLFSEIVLHQGEPWRRWASIIWHSHLAYVLNKCFQSFLERKMDSVYLLPWPEVFECGLNELLFTNSSDEFIFGVLCFFFEALRYLCLCEMCQLLARRGLWLWASVRHSLFFIQLSLWMLSKFKFISSRSCFVFRFY